MLIPPYSANELGRRKIPDPIIFPMTRAVATYIPTLPELFDGSFEDISIQYS
jgi:hypothetical protein